MTAAKTNEPMDVMLEYARQRAQGWRDAADRAEIRNEPVLAIIYKNIAWEIFAGETWLDSMKIKE